MNDACSVCGREDYTICVKFEAPKRLDPDIVVCYPCTTTELPERSEPPLPPKKGKKK